MNMNVVKDMYVSVPIVPSTSLPVQRSRDHLSGFKRYLKEVIKINTLRYQVLIDLLEQKLEPAQQQHLSDMVKGDLGTVILDTFCGSQMTLAGLSRLWGDDHVNDEFMDTYMWFTSKTRGSKTFSIPNLYLTRVLSKYKKPSVIPDLSELNHVTAPFVFRQGLKHWGMIGFDVKKNRVWYGEPLNSETYILDENTHSLFLRVLLHFFPHVQVIAISLKDSFKVKFPQQRDSWSCGYQICLLNGLMAKELAFPISFSEHQIIASKIEYICKLVHHRMTYLN